MKTKERIIQAALLAARQIGYLKISGETVAHRANVTRGVVQYYFPSMRTFRNILVQEAIKNEDLPIIAQALGMRHPDALEANGALTWAAMRYMLTGVEDV